MSKRFKKLTATILSLIMILGMVPITSGAEDLLDSPNSTEEIVITQTIDDEVSQSEDSTSDEDIEYDVGDADSLSDFELFSETSEIPDELMGIQALSDGADPGLDLLLQGYNIFGGTELIRPNINELIPFAGRQRLRQLDFSTYTGGSRTTYNYHAANSMEDFTERQSMDIKTTWGVGAGTSNDRKAGINLGIMQLGSTFMASANYRYDQSKFTSSSSSFKTAYESFYSSLEIRRELGKNHIIDPEHALRTYNTQIWNELSQGARDALLTGDINNLFNRFGTHIITSYNFGGRADQFVGIIRTSSSHETSIREEISKSHGGSGGISQGGSVGVEGLGSIGTNQSFNASANWMRNTITTAERLSNSKTHDYTATSVVSGGNLDIGSVLDPDSRPGAMNGWLNSINPADPVNTTEIFVDRHLELVGIWELLPPGNESRRSNIQKAFLDEFHSLGTTFYDEYVYNLANIVREMEKPQFDNTYHTISTAQELIAVGANTTTLSRNYILENDIDLSGLSWNPIGTQSNPFTGRFEGNGHTVRGVGVAHNSSAPGLFGFNSGTIRYLGVLYTSRYGGVAGVNNGTISDCYVDFAQILPVTQQCTTTCSHLYITPTQVINIANNTTVMPSFTTVANSVVLIDFTNRTTLSFNNMHITVPSTVQTVVFKGVDRQYTALNISIQGNDTDVVFEQFSYIGTNSSTSAAALNFTGSNPGLILRGNRNRITGYGRYAESNGNRAVVEANGNLFICGDASFIVRHNNTASSATSGDSGKFATFVRNTLNIALNAELDVQGGNGRNGSTGAAGVPNPGANNFNSWRDGQNGGQGSQGVRGGDGGFGIFANTLNILSNTSIKAVGGNGANGGIGGVGGAGGNGGGTGGDYMFGWGGYGGYGGTGGAGGRGGHGISVNTLVLHNNSTITLTGGAGGAGNRGGHGGAGGNGGGCGMVGLGGYGGGGGDGGTGGAGGNGGTPLTVSGTHNLNQSSLQYYMNLTAGAGGAGGNGGTGAGGGNGGANTWGTRVTGGNGGYGGYGGAGGYHGLLDIVGGINGRVGNVFTGSGGTGAFGGKCGSGTTHGPGISYDGVRAPNGFSNTIAATFLIHIRGTQISITPNASLWTTRLHQFTIGAESPDNRKTTYYLGDIFDPSGFLFRNNSNGVIPHGSIDFKYDFSKIGPTLVTATYYVGSVAVVRYIPVTVTRPTVTSVEIVEPARTFFYVDQDFDSKGIALLINYSDGHKKLINTGVTVDLSEGHIFTTADLGKRTISVLRPAYEGTANHPGIPAFSGSYTIEVVNDWPILLEVTKLPSIDQLEGVRFNPFGMEFRVLYESGYEEHIISNYAENGITFSHNILGQPIQRFPITATYKNSNAICTFEVPIQHNLITGLELRPPIVRGTLNEPNFYAGNLFDHTGIEIRALRREGLPTLLSWSDIDVYPDNGLLPSDNEIIFSFYNEYTGSTLTLRVPIIVAPVIQTGIEIANMPDRQDYVLGQTFDPTGMIVDRVFNNGSREGDISGYTLSHGVLNLSDNVVIVSNNGFKVEVPVFVQERTAVELQSITMPIKTIYVEGDAFDSSGMILRAIYNDGFEDNDVQGYGIIPNRPLRISDTEVEITLGSASFIIPITVTEVKPTGLTLNRTQLTLFTGNKSLLSATVTPENAADKTIEWTSSNEEVATVDSFGEVAALVEGTAVITAKTTVGGIIAVCTINVVSDAAALLSVSSVSTLPGKTITVDINILNNPGFAGMALKVSFPTELTLTRYMLGSVELMGGFTGPDGVFPGADCNISNHFYLIWGRTSEYARDGTLVTLTFEIDDGARPDDYPIVITFEQHNGPRTPVNLQGAPLNIFIQDEDVTVLSHILGSVTDSGVVGPADLVMLARWIAGHNVTINELAADITGRSEIGPADLVLLARWIAGHFGDLTLEELRVRD